MPVTAPTSWIEVRADTDPYKRDLKNLDRDSSTIANQVGQNFSKGVGQGSAKGLSTLDQKLGTVSRKAGVFADRMKYASGIAGIGLLYAGQQASNLNETISFTEVTFKESSKTMIGWAETSLDSMGIARESALDAANQFGGLFNLLGEGTEESARLSQQMVQLAVDMSSAKNVSLDEAVLALGAGLRGESEPLRRFNVLLSDAAIQAYAVKSGISDGNTELTEAQKVQARLGLIMEQTSDIQGDYARTADSAANAQRRAMEAGKDAAAEFGNSVAPIMADAAEIAADVTGAFAAMPEPLQKTAVAMGLLVLAASPLSAAIGLAAKAWQSYLLHSAAANTLASTTATSMGPLSIQMGRGATALSAAGTAARFFTTAVKGVGVALLVFKGLELAVQRVVEFKDEVGDEGFWSAVEGHVNKVSFGGQELEKNWFAAGEQIPKTAEKFDSLEASSDRLTGLAGHFEDIEDASYSTANQLGETGKAVRAFAGLTQDEFGEWRKETRGAINSVDDILQRFAGRSEVSADRILNAFGKQLSHMRDYEQNWRKLLRRGLPDSLTQQLQEMGMEGAGIVDALANANDKDFERIIRKWLRAEGVSKSVANAIIADMNREKGKSKDLRDELDKHPPRVKIPFSTPGLSAANEQVRTMLQNLGQMPDEVNIRATTSGLHRGDGIGMSAVSMANQAIAAVPGFQVITNSYRTPAHNAAVGGVPNSYHMDRANPAADIGGENLLGIYKYLLAFPTRELLNEGDHIHVADHGGEFMVRNRSSRIGLVGIGPGVQERVTFHGAEKIGGGRIDRMDIERAIAKGVAQAAMANRHMELALELDGYTVSRQVTLHQDRNRLLLQGRRS